MMNSNLISGFWESVRRNPDAPALEAGQEVLSYRQLGDKAQGVARALRHSDTDAPLIALFCERGLTAYVGILGILTAGKGYMPLNKHFPDARNAVMLDQSQCTTLLVDQGMLPRLGALLQHSDRPMTILGVDIQDYGDLVQKFPMCRFVSSDGYADADFVAPPILENSVAYLLFTSGSTGTPKGVPVTHANAAAYVSYFLSLYPLKPGDRASQTFDLTFDPSVHDLFVTWWSGACLCSVPDDTRLAPAQFIRDRSLTVWYSVPSIAVLLKKFRLLTPGAFPLLRLSLFSGEALPTYIAQEWQEAAPNSDVCNLYGPTEFTINITAYFWDREGGLEGNKTRDGKVSIGPVFPTQKGRLLDEHNQTIEGEGVGELVLAGSQITPGYWHAPDKTAERYIQLPDAPGITWYRTGDLIARDGEGYLYFLSRIDHQVKIQGHRVELDEISHVLQKITQEALVSTVTVSSHQGETVIVSFIAGDAHKPEAEILAQCKKILPSYMIPKKILFLKALPFNANGKIDRAALTEQARKTL